MPVYEEKVISPLALRFTQERIRPYFRDCREVEETICQITIKPGSGDYDVIFETPFPNIEIIRWHQVDRDDVKSSTAHWFTLDNRRLYCLQRVAIALWPVRCGACVDVLYGVPQSIWKKNDSLTAGRTVTIQHTSHLEVWDWRVTAEGFAQSEVREIASFVGLDDSRCYISELDNASAPLSMIDLFLQSRSGVLPVHMSIKAEEIRDQFDRCSTDTGNFSSGSNYEEPSPRSDVIPHEPSADATDHVHATPPVDARINSEDAMPQVDRYSTNTGDLGIGSINEQELHPSDEILHDAAADVSHESCANLVALRLSLSGSTWVGEKGELYEVEEAFGEATWRCNRVDANGSRRKYTMWYDEVSDCIWWGIDWSHYAVASHLLQDPNKLRWIAGHNTRNSKPRFSWCRLFRGHVL